MKEGTIGNPVVSTESSFNDQNLHRAQAYRLSINILPALAHADFLQRTFFQFPSILYTFLQYVADEKPEVKEFRFLILQNQILPHSFSHCHGFIGVRK